MASSLKPPPHVPSGLYPVPFSPLRAMLQGCSFLLMHQIVLLHWISSQTCSYFFHWKKYSWCYWLISLLAFITKIFQSWLYQLSVIVFCPSVLPLEYFMQMNVVRVSSALATMKFSDQLSMLLFVDLSAASNPVDSSLLYKTLYSLVFLLWFSSCFTSQSVQPPLSSLWFPLDLSNPLVLQWRDWQFTFYFILHHPNCSLFLVY